MTESGPGDTPDPEDMDHIGYAEAAAELEVILAELERDTVDVDRLATQVKRAAELIRVCRGRITSARMQVDSVMSELERATDLGAEG